MKRLMMNLQLFAEGDPPTSTAAVPPELASAPVVVPSAAPQEIDYSKLASIVQGKQTATEDSVLRGYFKQQGLSKEDADNAIAEFKEKQKANDPNQKVQELQEKLNSYENEKLLSKKHVQPDDFDYVSFKAAHIAKEKKISFEKAVDSFLKDNPKIAGSGTGYRVVSTGTQSSGAGTSSDSNDFINAAIRRAAGKEI